MWAGGSWRGTSAGTGTATPVSLTWLLSPSVSVPPFLVHPPADAVCAELSQPIPVQDMESPILGMCLERSSSDSTSGGRLKIGVGFILALCMAQRGSNHPRLVCLVEGLRVSEWCQWGEQELCGMSQGVERGEMDLNQLEVIFG